MEKNPKGRIEQSADDDIIQLICLIIIDSPLWKKVI